MTGVNDSDDATPDRRHIAERARFHITLGALRAALEEQPSPASVRATYRRWTTAAAQLADEVAKNMQNKNEEGDQ
ncbi:hypothetical protein [Streptomyces sp. H39-C1]|uniref:hypothetical protein n=1 Tax=Streptomyces sp. H39-C1 TaxID=3004355 RepID=UPI0022AF0E66|nr:hypothetical protein [Streptomyces sp. H39-C1]MCZ4099871.1 hypothetical protein [Streptomyces sp. H39-C1]